MTAKTEPKPKGWKRRERRASQQQAFAIRPNVVMREAASANAQARSAALNLPRIGEPSRRMDRAALSLFVWRTQDGRELPLPTLRDAHLHNAMDMLSKQRAAAQSLALDAQRTDQDQFRAFALKAAKCAQWLYLMEEELLRRHPVHMATKPRVRPTGMELWAMPDFYTRGVQHGR